jgi:glycosyltransferase involved in cell wall biosynthesis
MISIALITYNGENYIRELLDSIIAQTIQDYELVVCDDCSFDSTLSILDEYAQKDNRIKVYKNEKNIGFLKNIEKAIKLCRGEFIALADQDDIWEKEHLQILHSNIGNNLLICGDSLIVDKDNNSLDFRLSQMYQIDISVLKNNGERFLRLLLMNNFYQGAAMMFCKKSIDIALPFPDKIEYHDLWFALCAMALDKFVYIPLVVIRHRRHLNNLSGMLNRDIEACFVNKMEYILPLENLSDASSESKQIIKQAKDFFSNKTKILKYHKAMLFWIKNYRILYATNSKNKFLMRLWKIFFHYQLIRFPFKIKDRILSQFKERA